MSLKKIDQKKRNNLSISRRRIVSMINLYEQYVDERIVHICPSGIIKGEYYEYRVDIDKNRVEKIYPDHVFD